MPSAPFEQRKKAKPVCKECKKARGGGSGDPQEDDDEGEEEEEEEEDREDEGAAKPSANAWATPLQHTAPAEGDAGLSGAFGDATTSGSEIVGGIICQFDDDWARQSGR